MRLKKMTVVLLSTTMTLSMGITSFAGSWQQDGSGYWYQNDDGSYPTNGWQWIDSNNDGVAECYYFDANGYMLSNTTTPDGYQVNSDGAWIENGVVKTQSMQKQETTNGVRHSEGYDPAHPLAHKVDEWNLRLYYGYLANNFYIGSNNVQALLTNQMDQYQPNEITEASDQALYNWFCNWLNGMDWESMTEMERAQEIKKALAEATRREYEDGGSMYTVLIEKHGDCSSLAFTTAGLAKALGLKAAVNGTTQHAFGYIQVDGVTYASSNQKLDLDFPSPDIIYRWK